MQQLVGDPILSALASPSDLQGYLQTGVSALLNATRLKDRALYLEHHAEDRANGFAPARELEREAKLFHACRRGLIIEDQTAMGFTR